MAAAPPADLQVAALGLLALQGLEEGLEVADPETPRPVALDDLEEERGAVLDRAGEDLEQEPFLVAVGFDAQPLERFVRHTHVPDTLLEPHVVLVRHLEELDPVLAEAG